MYLELYKVSAENCSYNSHVKILKKSIYISLQKEIVNRIMLYLKITGPDLSQVEKQINSNEML